MNKLLMEKLDEERLDWKTNWNTASQKTSEGEYAMIQHGAGLPETVLQVRMSTDRDILNDEHVEHVLFVFVWKYLKLENGLSLHKFRYYRHVSEEEEERTRMLYAWKWSQAFLNPCDLLTTVGDRRLFFKKNQELIVNGFLNAKKPQEVFDDLAERFYKGEEDETGKTEQLRQQLQEQVRTFQCAFNQKNMSLDQSDTGWGMEDKDFELRRKQLRGGEILVAESEKDRQRLDDIPGGLRHDWTRRAIAVARHVESHSTVDVLELLHPVWSSFCRIQEMWKHSFVPVQRVDRTWNRKLRVAQLVFDLERGDGSTACRQFLFPEEEGNDMIIDETDDEENHEMEQQETQHIGKGKQRRNRRKQRIRKEQKRRAARLRKKAEQESLERQELDEFLREEHERAKLINETRDRLIGEGKWMRTKLFASVVGKLKLDQQSINVFAALGVKAKSVDTLKKKLKSFAGYVDPAFCSVLNELLSIDYQINHEEFFVFYDKPKLGPADESTSRALTKEALAAVDELLEQAKEELSNFVKKDWTMLYKQPGQANKSGLQMVDAMTEDIKREGTFANSAAKWSSLEAVAAQKGNRGLRRHINQNLKPDAVSALEISINSLKKSVLEGTKSLLDRLETEDGEKLDEVASSVDLELRAETLDWIDELGHHAVNSVTENRSNLAFACDVALGLNAKGNLKKQLMEAVLATVDDCNHQRHLSAILRRLIKIIAEHEGKDVGKQMGLIERYVLGCTVKQAIRNRVSQGEDDEDEELGDDQTNDGSVQVHLDLEHMNEESSEEGEEERGFADVLRAGLKVRLNDIKRSLQSVAEKTKRVLDLLFLFHRERLGDVFTRDDMPEREAKRQGDNQRKRARKEMEDMEEEDDTGDSKKQKTDDGDSSSSPIHDEDFVPVEDDEEVSDEADLGIWMDGRGKTHLVRLKHLRLIVAALEGAKGKPRSERIHTTPHFFKSSADVRFEASRGLAQLACAVILLHCRSVIIESEQEERTEATKETLEAEAILVKTKFLPNLSQRTKLAKLQKALRETEEAVTASSDGKTREKMESKLEGLQHQIARFSSKWEQLKKAQTVNDVLGLFGRKGELSFEQVYASMNNALSTSHENNTSVLLPADTMKVAALQRQYSSCGFGRHRHGKWIKDDYFCYPIFCVFDVLGGLSEMSMRCVRQTLVVTSSDRIRLLFVKPRSVLDINGVRLFRSTNGEKKDKRDKHFSFTPFTSNNFDDAKLLLLPVLLKLFGLKDVEEFNTKKQTAELTGSRKQYVWRLLFVQLYAVLLRCDLGKSDAKKEMAELLVGERWESIAPGSSPWTERPCWLTVGNQMPHGRIWTDRYVGWMDRDTQEQIDLFGCDPGKWEAWFVKLEANRSGIGVRKNGTKLVYDGGTYCDTPMPTMAYVAHILGYRESTTRLALKSMECMQDDDDLEKVVDQVLRRQKQRDDLVEEIREVAEDIQNAIRLFRVLVDKWVGKAKSQALKSNKKAVVVAFGRANFSSVAPIAWLAERLAREVVVVMTDEHCSSKKCSACGHEVKTARWDKRKRWWKCTSCNFRTKDAWEEVKGGRKMHKDRMAACTIAWKLVAAMNGLEWNTHSRLYGKSMDSFRESLLNRGEEEAGSRNDLGSKNDGPAQNRMELLSKDETGGPV
eukprot:TRINITY_DN11_c0_g1_i10.p1 TRINITY_DN11_c0_g1~~TRINITY_DN11_c0_g1_i10.p1  ORF type:complete len:1638 (-),score=408.77 TRINITY_DN11_c0_g1_i10:1685-6598(-)